MFQGRYVTLSCSNGVATLTLHHPSRPNPLSWDLQTELKRAIELVATSDEPRCLIVAATGAAFCVGADLAEVMQIEAEGEDIAEWMASTLGELTNPIALALRSLPVPVVCAVQGAAAGAGVGLALSADILLMSEDAYLYLPFAPRLGLIPDLGSTWHLVRQIGRQRTAALTLLGDRLPARLAVEWGLALEVFPTSGLMPAAEKYADALRRLPRGIAGVARSALDSAQTSTLSVQLEFERVTQLELLRGGAFREGVDAFLSKREPRFC